MGKTAAVVGATALMLVGGVVGAAGVYFALERGAVADKAKGALSVASTNSNDGDPTADPLWLCNTRNKVQSERLERQSRELDDCRAQLPRSRVESGVCTEPDSEAPVVPVGHSITQKKLSITVRNRSTKTVDAVRMSGLIFNAFDERALRRMFDGQLTNEFNTHHDTSLPPNSERRLCCWNVSDFTAAKRAEIVVSDVHFTDGTAWHGCAETDPKAAKPQKKGCNLPWPAVCEEPK